ncbi:PLAC8-domain-containing protein [Lindgomyces ingoldianus]|uniref:PLAC8-domain-containing protein n=1 Tax=Lindgomyces ingoldianus TaxID=673940 RepID=A0ACB6QPN4_9PLEO|nr:PLAC8-domain-containing protein [Lindgomyces ingoldianus]KAF2468881.1 PLAC8-domain-containing protein [Lindgomyces ingoldianus]
MDNGHYGQRQHLQPQNVERQHQRFSWQIPLTGPPEDTSASQPQQQQTQQQPAQINTNVNANGRAFSYAQTPIEHRARYTSSADDPPLPQSPPTPIDTRPQSICKSAPSPPAPPQPQATYPSYPYENTARSPVSPYNSTPQHPALVSPISPIAEPQQIHRQQPNHHARQRSNLSPINTNITQYTLPPVPATPHSHKSQASALPQKTPITPISPNSLRKDPAAYPLPMSPNSKKSYAAEPYSPHGFSSNTGANHTIFSPDAATGPNGLDFALHQPGQIAHPNMDLSTKGSSHEWKHSLCECSGDISTCLTGIFCPCILYGRTSYRLSQKSDKKDPTDMLGYKSTNGHCILMGVACGLQWLFPMIHRTKIRHLYKLSGSCAGDFARSCCCCCCVAIQNEREVRGREESKRQWAGPASNDVYRAPEMMVYSPQR